ncbi:hypothetical protein KAR91_43025 [Candidatus Pacearchaeota archaeon]|nr:hypothetical protein [Candidatus Pacearchaeota archaeon]
MKKSLLITSIACLFVSCLVLNSFAVDLESDEIAREGQQKALDEAFDKMLDAWDELQNVTKDNAEFEKAIGEKIDILFSLKNSGGELMPKIGDGLDVNDKALLMVFIQDADVAVQLTNACLYMFYMHIPTSDNKNLNSVVMHYFKYAIEQLDGVENRIQRLLSGVANEGVSEYANEIYANILLSKRILQDFQLKIAKNPYEELEELTSDEGE